MIQRRLRSFITDTAQRLATAAEHHTGSQE